MHELVAVDIGGTHARFAIAQFAGGKVTSVSQPQVVKTSEHPTFEAAWDDFCSAYLGDLPQAASIALAGRVQGDVVRLTNSPWTISRSWMTHRLNGNPFKLVNDFGAIAHAVAQLDSPNFQPICGPQNPLPDVGTITILGPGTGLGVAQIVRGVRSYEVVETEGGHVGFSPLDDVDAQLWSRLQKKLGRVSAERLISGAGLFSIYTGLAELNGAGVKYADERSLWSSALNNTDALALEALERFSLMLGSFAGDMALAHGSAGVVIAGGLGQRLNDYLPSSRFEEGFIAKGRFSSALSKIPVKMITYPEPGIYGAAAAFARDYVQ
jgi:glucokinase